MLCRRTPSTGCCIRLRVHPLAAATCRRALLGPTPFPGTGSIVSTGTHYLIFGGAAGPRMPLSPRKAGPAPLPPTSSNPSYATLPCRVRLSPGTFYPRSSHQMIAPKHGPWLSGGSRGSCCAPPSPERIRGPARQGRDWRFSCRRKPPGPASPRWPPPGLPPV